MIDDANDPANIGSALLVFLNVNPKTAIKANEKYTDGLNPKGINKSDNAIAAIGKTIAKRLSLKRAEPNKAIAPIAVKLAGWGRNRVAAANKTNALTAIVDCIVSSFFML